MDDVKLYLGNCIGVMASMPDNSVDAIVTDLPYGLDFEYGIYIDSEENLKSLIAEFMPQARRVAKRVVLTCGVNRMWLYPNPDWVACWYMVSGGAAAMWGGFGVWQPVLCYGRDRKMRLGRRPDVIVSNAPDKDKYGHPCPKPLDFVCKLVEFATEKGETVLDPFMGSGTTGVACIRSHRKFVGIELQPEYYKTAEQRIHNARADMGLEDKRLAHNVTQVRMAF